MGAFLTSQARQQSGRALGEWAQSNAQVERQMESVELLSFVLKWL